MGVIRATRRGTGTFAGTALLAASLLSTLTACGSEVHGSQSPADQRPQISLQAGTPALEEALERQATAQDPAAEKAVREKAAAQARKSRSAPSVADDNACTTDPADRLNCHNPGGTIDPNGGDLDGDGVFEENEPVGPGYKDPRAYDGGKTSGETQCAWLRSQGIAC
ncbi:hypothetical protein ACWGJT_24765 [Streptomyces xantholiticus]